MGEIDFLSAWQALKVDLVDGQRSRGRDELLATMARIEVAEMTQEGYSDRPLPRPQLIETPTARTA